MRVLFSCIGGSGHFLPLLPLARAFEADGHIVAFATAADFGEHVAAAGFENLPAGLSARELEADMAPYKALLLEMPTDERRPRNFAWRFATLDAPRKVDDLHLRATEWRPDLIVHDTADLAAPLVATALDVPSVNHGFGRMVPPACLEEAAPMTAALWRRYGLDPEPDSGIHRGVYVDICPSSLQDLAPPPGVRALPMRPSGTTDGDAAWRRRFPAGRPVVYVTLGTVFNDLDLFRVVLDGLAGLDATVLATIGANNDPAALAPHPEHAIVERYVPQAGVLPFVDVAVGHGGSGSTLAALAHGIPLVLLPQAADQFENAHACAALGLARVASSADDVRAAVESLLADDAAHAAAARISDEIRRMPSPSAVAAALSG